MNSVFRILENQFELNDAIDSCYYKSSTSRKIYEDENGKYKIKNITKEVYCGCHPETCCHFGGKRTVFETEKIYLKKETNDDVKNKCEHKEIYLDGSWYRCKKCNETIY